MRVRVCVCEWKVFISSILLIPICLFLFFFSSFFLFFSLHLPVIPPPPYTLFSQVCALLWMKGGEDEVWGWQAEREMKGRKRGRRKVLGWTDGENEGNERRGRTEVWGYGRQASL